MKRSISLMIGVLTLAMVASVPALAQNVTIIVDEQNGSSFNCDRSNFQSGGGFGGGTNVACESIRNAIDIANSGDTILVEAGTYDNTVEDFANKGPIDVDKSLTIESRAAGGGGFGGGGGANTRPLINRDNNTHGTKGVFRILHNDVTIQGFEIQNAGGEVGILIPNAQQDIDIVDNEFNGIANQAGNGTNNSAGANDVGFGIQAQNSLGDFSFRNNSFLNLGNTQTDSHDAKYGVGIAINSVANNDADVSQQILGNTFQNISPGGNDLDQTPSVEFTFGTGDDPFSNARTNDFVGVGISVNANGNNLQIGDNAQENAFGGTDIDLILFGDASNTTVRGNDFGDSREVAITGPFSKTVDAEQNWWGDSDGPATTFSESNQNADFVEPAKQVNDANPLPNPPGRQAGGGFGGGGGPGGGAGGQQGDVVQATLACDSSVTNVSITITDGSGTTRAFASLSCDDFFTNREEDTFTFSNSAWDPDTSTVTINFFSTKDGQGAFQSVTLSPNQVEPGVDYILATNSSAANVWADLDGDGQLDADGSLAAAPATNKQPTLTFSTTGGGGGGGTFGASVQPLEVNTIEMTRSGFNYALSVQGQGVASTQVAVYDLTGRRVISERSSGNTLRFRPMTSNGAPLANGVYLYQVTVRGHDGTVKSMGVRKMLVLR